MKYSVLAWALLLMVVSLSGCGKFRKIQKSDDWKVKYDAALEYYEDNDFYRANLLLEEILPVLRGTEYAEKATFLFASTQYKLDNYILAAYHFKNFYETYGRSSYAEEAMYMYAKALYAQSPKFNLDQTSTYEAVAALQIFLNRYPSSEYREEATKVIDELQQKLEKKAFENAKLYYQLRNYKSALVAFDNFREDYPDSDLNEQIGYLKVKAAYEYASRSVLLKQRERYRNTLDYYQEFVDNYPESNLLRDAGDIYEKALNDLEKLKDNTVSNNS